MITVAEINDIERLSEFRLLWRTLWDKTCNASFFQSLDWLENYWHRFGAQQKLRTLIVSVGGKPIGIVPFVVKEVPSRLGPVRALTYPLDSWGAFYGPLDPNPAATLAAAMRHISETKRDWDLIDLRYIDAEGTDRGRTQNAMRSAGLQTYRRPWHSTSTVRFSDLDWDAYWDSRSSECRQHCEDAEQRLSQVGPLLYVRYRPEGTCCGETDRRWKLVDDCQTLVRNQRHATVASAAAGVTAAGVTAVGVAAARDNFLHELHTAAVDAGAADVNILYLGGKPVACAYNYHFNGTVDSAELAVDADFASAAGMVLMNRMLRDGMDRGDATFVFGPGHANLKRMWQTDAGYSFRYTHFALTAPRAQVLRLNHCVKQCFVNDVSPKPLKPRVVASAKQADTDEPTRPRLAVLS